MLEIETDRQVSPEPEPEPEPKPEPEPDGLNHISYEKWAMHELSSQENVENVVHVVNF